MSRLFIRVNILLLSVFWLSGCGGGSTSEKVEKNTTPIAKPDSVTTKSDSSIFINVLSNDTDNEGDSLMVTLLSDPSHGSVIPLNNGFSYSPDDGYTGEDSFTYTLSDGELSSEGTVSINITDERILKVGVGEVYSKLSDIGSDLRDGDIIEITAGTYSDSVVWNKNNITIRGVGGMAHIVAPSPINNRKAILVLDGQNILLENIELSGASVPDKNGAGIRFQSGSLRIKNCYFHNNENGLLSSAGNTMTLIIEDSEFSYNGYGDGYSHNIYVGHIAEFTLRHSYIHHANFAADAGHLVKSRASVNTIIYNRIMDEENGRASRQIDLPNGGKSYIEGNLIHQSASASNSNMVGYALEGATNAIQELYIKDNVFVSERSNGSFVKIKSDTSLQFQNNIFIGNSTLPSANNGDTGSTFIANGDLSDAVTPNEASTAGLSN